MDQARPSSCHLWGSEVTMVFPLSSSWALMEKGPREGSSAVGKNSAEAWRQESN